MDDSLCGFLVVPRRCQMHQPAASLTWTFYVVECPSRLKGIYRIMDSLSSILDFLMISSSRNFLDLEIDLAGSLVVRQGASRNKLWPNTERESCRWRCISSGSWLPWKRNLWSTLRPPTPKSSEHSFDGRYARKTLGRASFENNMGIYSWRFLLASLI